MKMTQKWALLVTLSAMSAVASADIINNAGAKRLEQETVALLSQSQISAESSMQFLKRNRFALDDVMWQKTAQIIHGPIHIADGEEEGMGVPYLLAYNQGKSVVGVGGWMSPSLLKKLRALPQVTCRNVPQDTALWVCAHQSAKSEVTTKFTRDLVWLAQNSN